MIKSITSQQQEYFDNLIQEYLKDITEFPETNKEEAIRVCQDMAESMNVKKPIIIFGKNPYETILICEMSKVIFGNSCESKKDSQLGSQLGSQLRTQLSFQLESQLESQLDSQLSFQLESQLYSQIDSQLDSQLYSQLWSQLDSQLDSQLRTQLKNINDNWYLSLWWRYWDCFYQFGKHIGIKFDNKKLDLLNRFLKHCYFVVPHEGIWFVSENPIKTNWNNKKQLHNDNKSCLEFKSSLDVPTFEIFCLNGISVPEYLVKTPESKLDINWFLEEKNADIKAEFIRKYGIDRMIHLGKQIDTYENHNNDWWTKSEYKLIDMSAIFESIDYAPHLYMKNQTTGIYHLEAVTPDCKNLIDAIGKTRWNGRDLNKYTTIDIK